MSDASIVELLAELDALIGLAPVKEAIHRLVAIHQLNAVRAAADEPTIAQSLDLVFAGDPGTGEDVVARIVGQLYAELGVLAQGHVVEVTRVDLVGATTEATRAQVLAAVTAARQGVLFVDDAHLLIPQSAVDLGGVAIASLVAAMGTRTTPFAVILAGPTQAMELIIEHHPALHLAFENMIEFPRYTPDELLAIFRQKVGDLKIKVSPAVLAAVRNHLVEIYDGGRFKTARYVPDLVGEMYARLATRTMTDGVADADERRAFAVADVPPAAAAALTDTGLRVGFSGNLAR